MWHWLSFCFPVDYLSVDCGSTFKLSSAAWEFSWSFMGAAEPCNAVLYIIFSWSTQNVIGKVDRYAVYDNSKNQL